MVSIRETEVEIFNIFSLVLVVLDSQVFILEALFIVRLCRLEWSALTRS